MAKGSNKKNKARKSKAVRRRIARTNVIPTVTQPLLPAIRNPEATLLGLPAELRNDIYRLVLVDPNMIPVIPERHKQPGLLRTCRQIRREALSIFKDENSFYFAVCDLRPLYPHFGHWLHGLKNKSVIFKAEEDQTVRLGRPEWGMFRNLVEWGRSSFEDPRVPIVEENMDMDNSPTVAVVRSMFEVLQKCDEVFRRMGLEPCWEKVLDVLLEWKEVVATKPKVQSKGWFEWKDEEDSYRWYLREQRWRRRLQRAEQ